MDMRTLSERDICSKFILPALIKAGWDLKTQISEERTLTDGRIIVRGKMVARGRKKRADYVLYLRPNIPIAVIEAKDNKHSIADGMQQALTYANMLRIPFAFSSNGDGFVFHDATGQSDKMETQMGLDEFPSPDTLLEKYKIWKGLSDPQAKTALHPYFDSEKTPRYYQMNAINASLEAISKDQERLLLVMATGTGKTLTAFQIIWRLWKSGAKKRVLFLADRNILIDQTMVNDFRPFIGDMAKLSSHTKTIERADGTSEDIALAIDKKRRINTAYQIYLGLYQALTGPKESQKIFKELSPDFFDLIIIDECHRGSAADDSAWREILEHFSSATHIGLTATPKETEYASNIDYFGEPVYSYTLREGIDDGFLAPYKVIKCHIDHDVAGYRPHVGQLDRDGVEIDDRIYNTKDFDRVLVIDDRTKLVAQRITQFLKESGDQMQKTIIFCVDQEHAARMRQALINENQDLVAKDVRYVMRITGGDKDGVNELANFIDPESAYPVLVTTSRLLSTGVDAQTCRLIVLDRQIGSMTEFKQIVGRGTRVHKDTEKYYFTLMDFRGATNHFADPDFDGDPVQIYQPTDGGPMLPPDDDGDPIGVDNVNGGLNGDDELEVLINPVDIGHAGTINPTGDTGPIRKIYIDGVGATIIKERVEYLDADGNLVTESLRDFTRKHLTKRFASMDDFLRRWNEEDRKQVILDELAEEGLDLNLIGAELAKDLDPFDLVCHIAFDAKPLTRQERANNVKKRDVFNRYGEQARKVLEALLDKYADGGVFELDDTKILQINPFAQMGTQMELMRAFGKRPDYLRAVHDLQNALYEESA
jgi:type I restriction enzyme R subunit